MKLNRTREEWAALVQFYADGPQVAQDATSDISTLHAEVERLREALANIADRKDQLSMTWAAEYARRALGDTHD